MEKRSIYGLSLSGLREFFREQGENPAKAEIVYRQLYRENRQSFAAMEPLGRKAKALLEEAFDMGLPRVLRRLEDEGAAKYLLEMADGAGVECVVMKHPYGWSLCLSTQVGCAMGCRFCASGTGGKQRDLTPAELMAQLLLARRETGQPIYSLTLMGMGEPFDNFDNVCAFLDIATEPAGLDIGPRHVTVSTCGLPDEIRRFALRPRPHNLCVSLHAPTDELRRYLMPQASRHTLSQVLEAAQDYAAATRQKVVFEYALLDGVNDGDIQAAQLAELLTPLPCSVNLIPYNPTGGAFRPSPHSRVLAFYHVLKQKGLSVTIRRKLGEGLQAACGQLRACRLKEEQPPSHPRPSQRLE